MGYIHHRAEESLEDYLETILILQNKIGNVRSIDIVNEMDYTKPSVSIAMKKLREKNLITMNENNYISFTDEGRQRAESVLERHTVLSSLLESLGVSPEIAKADACRIEHDISEETFAIIKERVQNRK